MSRILTLVIFVVVIQAIGFALGTAFPADEWYQVLNKPIFNPPGYVFGIVWPILYLLIAIAGWRVFVSGGETPGWGYWVAQMVLNFAFPPLFFGMHQIFWSMVLIFVTLIAALGFSVRTWNHDRLASILFFPYIAWLSYALLLNVSLWWLN